MIDPLLNRLDEIEQLEPSPDTDKEVLELMEQIVRSPHGVHTLIKRYGHSSVPIIVRSLSFLLAVLASSPTVDSKDLVFGFMDRLQYREDESTLLNCLTAIRRLLMYDIVWDPLSEPPRALFPFLIHCLEQSVLVQRGALAVISRMYQDDILVESLNLIELSLLIRKIIHISIKSDPLLESEIDELRPLLNSEQLL